MKTLQTDEVTAELAVTVLAEQDIIVNLEEAQSVIDFMQLLAKIYLGGAEQ